MKKIRVNIQSNATSKPRKEKLNGRDVIRVSSATLPDNIVMNGIKYPAEEIQKSFNTLERAPAPLGHPMVNSEYVSASDPEGINGFWIGAWNENVRREKGRVLLDKVIDVEVASRTERGKQLLKSINDGVPMHTSTGVLMNLEESEEDGHEFVARNMWFDHDAILVDEEGAATPEQGVGMMVNSKGEKFEVVNSMIEDSAMMDLEWAADRAVRAVDRLDRASMIDRVKAAIIDALGGSGGETTTAENGDADMADNKQLEELSAKVNAIEESVKGLGQTVTDAVTNAVAPIQAHVDQISANQKAKDDAELAGHVEKIVKANLLDEDSAKELTLNAARKLAEKAVPGKAAQINGAFAGNSNPDDQVYDINEAMGLKQKEA